MPETRTVFSQIEITEEGIIQIRLDKQIVDGDRILAKQYHRTALEPGVSLDEQMTAVNAHLDQLGYPAAPVEVVERVRAIAAIEHTPARVAAFKAARDKAKGGKP